MRKPWFECHLFRFSRGYICVLGRIWFDLIWFVFLTSCWYSEIGRLARLALLVSIEIRNRYISMYQFYVQASMSATVVTTGSLATRNRFSQQEEGVNNTSILRDVQAFYSTLWWHTLGQLALSFPPSARWRAGWLSGGDASCGPFALRLWEYCAIAVSAPVSRFRLSKTRSYFMSSVQSGISRCGWHTFALTGECVICILLYRRCNQVMFYFVVKNCTHIILQRYAADGLDGPINLKSGHDQRESPDVGI